MTPLAIAAAMRRQASSAGLSRRQLTGGLLVRFSQAGEQRVLVLMRKQPGPSSGEREQWRKAFGVPLDVFEYKGPQGEYIFIQWEWKERTEL